MKEFKPLIDDSKTPRNSNPSYIFPALGGSKLTHLGKSHSQGSHLASLPTIMGRAKKTDSEAANEAIKHQAVDESIHAADEHRRQSDRPSEFVLAFEREASIVDQNKANDETTTRVTLPKLARDDYEQGKLVLFIFRL